MKTNRHAVHIAIAAALAFVAGRSGYLAAGTPAASAQDGAEEPPAVELSPEMQAVVDAGTPGKGHEVLDRLVGEWTGEFTMRSGPDDPALTSTGTVSREWILGERFVRETVVAESEFGPFEGWGFLGFNNLDGRYEVAWMDSASTAIHFETGTYHAGEQVLHVRGNYRDPATGRMINSWGKLDISDPDRHSYVGYSTDAEGRTFKAVEGVTERVGGQ